MVIYIFHLLLFSQNSRSGIIMHIRNCYTCVSLYFWHHNFVASKEEELLGLFMFMKKLKTSKKNKFSFFVCGILLAFYDFSIGAKTSHTFLRLNLYPCYFNSHSSPLNFLFTCCSNTLHPFLFSSQVVFMSSLFYVLSASGPVYKPVAIMVNLAPGQMTQWVCMCIFNESVLPVINFAVTKFIFLPFLQ